MRQLITIKIITLSTPWLFAQDTCSVAQRIFSFDDPITETISQSFGNPSLKIYEHATSLSNVSATYRHNNESDAIDPQKGSGQNYLQAGAQSHIKQENATVWGHAYYQKGTIKDVRFNETSDPDMIYPYITADTIGGDIELETYLLAGGYCAAHDKINYGVQLSYDAGLYYRNVDPRPKNITGLLDLKVGLSYTISSNYSIGTSFDASKYKQSSDIMFVCETGKTEILHLTGLGNHYNRFAGTSETSHYNGSRYAATIDLFPVNIHGLTATLSLSHYQFKKTLTDLNKLPLCHAWHKSVRVQVGYITSNISATCTFDAYRRHGTENIFGDALSGVYPVIGSLEMYADNMYQVTAAAAYRQKLTENRSLDFSVNAGYAHRCQIYAEPATEQLKNSYSTQIKAGYKAVYSDRWYLSAQIACYARIPDKSHFYSEGNDSKLYNMEYSRYNYESKSCQYTSISCEIARAIGRKYAISLYAAYSQGHHNDDIDTHDITTSIKLIF